MLVVYTGTVASMCTTVGDTKTVLYICTVF